MIDQNDVCNFGGKDVSLVFEKLKDTARTTYDTMKTNIDQNQQDRNLKNLRPIFESTLSDIDFFISKLFRVTTMDKKHVESKVCQNTIGHIDTYDGLEVINIYRDKANYFGLIFIPNNDAVKIDTAIKAMRFESRTSIVAEVNQESQRSFEYEIDF